MSSIKYGIMIKGCTFADLAAVLPLSSNGDPCLACDDHVAESTDVFGKEHYVVFGELAHGSEIPKISLNTEYWINTIKSSIAETEVTFSMVVND